MKWEKLYQGKIEPELRTAAKNAVKVCLSGKGGEKAVVICDEASRKGCASIALEMEEIGIDVTPFIIEQFGNRPISRFPSSVTQALSAAQLSLLWAFPQPGELRARSQILDIAVARNLRHAHIIGVSIEHFIWGLSVDYTKIQKLQKRLIEKLSNVRHIRVTNPAGTILDIPVKKGQEFVGVSGIIEPGRWENLPSGQLMCAPETADGTYIADSSIGEWFGTKYGDISSTPLQVEIENGKLRDAKCSNPRLAREFLLYVKSNPNGDRIGEFSIGTNIGLRKYTSVTSIDENIPGCHIAFGSPPNPLNTKVGWEAKTKVSLIGKSFDICFDDEKIMEGGKFNESLLDE